MAGGVGAEGKAAAQPRFVALRSPRFRALWLGLIASNVGGQMQVAAQGWLVRDLYAEPFYLGIVSLASALPLVLLTPFGGAIADRAPRRELLALTRLGMMVQTVLLALLTLGGWIELWHIVALSAASGLLLALDNPTRQALLPDLVPREHLAGAVSLFQVTWSGASLVGPALAGVLLAPLGAGGVFAVGAAAYVVVLYAIARLDLPPQAPGPRRPFAAGLLDGVRFAASDGLVATLLLLMAVVSLFGRSYLVLMPVFARDVLLVGPEGYGLLLAMPGAGAILGSFLLAAARDVPRKDRVVLGGLFGFALGLAVFATSRIFLASLAALLLGTVLSMVFSVSANTLLQLRVPGHLRGRVMSLSVTTNLGGSHFGGMLSAAAATLVSAPLAVAGGAAVIALVGTVAAARGGWRRAASRTEAGP